MLFVFCTCRAHNLAENESNLAENLKKLGSAEPVEAAFCKSDVDIISLVILIVPLMLRRYTQGGVPSQLANYVEWAL